MSDKRAVIKTADMCDEMQQDAVDCAMQEKYNIEKDIAAYVKKEFDKKYNPTSHCIVGRNFGSYVTHETKHFIYFYLDLPTSWWCAHLRLFVTYAAATSGRRFSHGSNGGALFLKEKPG
ncbi:hypothetical protein Q8A73_001836 [Channa argus]|nr:hypothetical protein Q8A73_001836 [Channa argus]